MHDIKVAEQGADQSVVSQGLTAGQKVVVAGQYRLQEGSTVAPTEAAAVPTKEAQNTPVKAP